MLTECYLRWQHLCKFPNAEKLTIGNFYTERNKQFNNADFPEKQALAKAGINSDEFLEHMKTVDESLVPEASLCLSMVDGKWSTPSKVLLYSVFEIHLHLIHTLNPALYTSVLQAYEL